MSYPTDRPATWFVTGTSRGLGLELVKQLLWRGDNVAATTRSASRLMTALGGRADLSRLLALTVDLPDDSAVDRAMRETTRRFGSLDVVVNNAGYGFLGAVEETSDSEVREMPGVQVIGVWNVLRAALPILRRQKGGHIVNVSSVLGLTAIPGWGLYCAAKFAIEGLSEALAAEVADFGVKVTVIQPGSFRTDFLTHDSLALPARTSEGYPAIRKMVDNHLDLQGNQLGDPAKGAKAVISRVVHGNGPLRQLLGSDAYSYASTKVDTLRADIEAGREIAHTTDFAAV